MAISLNTADISVPASSAQNAPTGLAALYPPSTTDKDSNVNTINGFIKGCGFKSINIKEGVAKASGNPYKMFELILFSKDDSFNEKEYKLIMQDFFRGNPNATDEKNLENAKRALTNYQNTFYAIFGTDKKGVEPMFPIVSDLDSMDKFRDYILNNVPSLDYYNPEASFKVVNQKDSGEKQYYNLSSNFPIVESPGFNEGKLKFAELKQVGGKTYGDIVVFKKTDGSTDGMLVAPVMGDIPEMKFDTSALPF